MESRKLSLPARELTYDLRDPGASGFLGIGSRPATIAVRTPVLRAAASPSPDNKGRHTGSPGDERDVTAEDRRVVMEDAQRLSTSMNEIRHRVATGELVYDPDERPRRPGPRDLRDGTSNPDDPRPGTGGRSPKPQRSAYQDQQAAGLMTLEELGSKLAKLDETRRIAAAEFATLDAREQRAKELQADRDILLDSYADMVPEALDDLSGEGRSRVYEMLQLEVRPDPEGYEVSGALCSIGPTGKYP
jgi:hypothetical protein